MPETTILKWEIDTASAEKNVDELTLSIDKNTKKLKDNKKQVTVLEKENKKLSNSLKGNTKDRKVAQQQIIKNTTQIKSLTIANAKQRDGITELNSKRRQEVKVSKVQAGSLNALRSNVSKLIKVRNNLNITTKKGRREFESMNKVILRQNNLIKRAEERGGDFRRSVGNYGKALGVVKGKLLGAIGGFFLLVKGIKDAIVTIRDFEKAMDKVQAITGATSDEINLLREDAIRLGGSTSKTATQVAELQTEFAKLGFSTQEILSATEATISLSIAAGTDLAQAATVAGATVRGFGLEADETQRIVDVMALSFSSSALDINKFQTAMGVVAPVAKSAGVSVEETTAILAQFVDAGLDASTAGTGLRNIFLELSKQGITLEEALEKIRTSSDANKTALELFGKRGATVGIIMANTADSADLLQKSLENAGGSAQEMANIMEDNLSGDVAKAGSAWEGLILSLDSGAGALTSIFRGVIQGVTSVLGFFIDANKTLIEEWEDQDKVVKQLEDDIDPLLTKYDDLIITAGDNEEKQRELEKVIEDIAEILPGAAIEWDKYGKVIGISTDRIKESLAAEKDRLKFINEDTIADLERRIELTQSSIGQLQRDIVQGFSDETVGGIFTRFKLFPSDIARSSIEINELSGKLSGMFAELRKRTGEDLDDPLKDDGSAAKAAAKAATLALAEQAKIDFAEVEAEEKKQKALAKIREKESVRRAKANEGIAETEKETQDLLTMQQQNALLDRAENAQEFFALREQFARENFDTQLGRLREEETAIKENAKLLQEEKDALLAENNLAQLELLQDFNDEKAEINDDFRETEDEKEEDAKRKKLDRVKEEETLIKELLISGGNTLLSLISAGNRKQEADINKSFDRRKAKLQIDLDNKIITQAEFDNQSEALEKQRARKLFQIELSQFKTDRAAALSGIAIDTAKNIVKAFPNPFLIAAAATLGVAQTAVVFKQPAPSPPSFAEGGDMFSVVKGKSHSEGGVDLYDSSGRTVANVEGGEGLFVTKKSATNEALQAISNINQQHGGRSFFAEPARYLQQGGEVTAQTGLDAKIVTEIVENTLQSVLENVKIVTNVEDIQNGLKDYSNTINQGTVE